MRKKYVLTGIFCVGFLLNTLVAQTIWTGTKTTFTKADGADWTQASNQDRITDNVWITRANSRGIFNIKSESAYVIEFSPADTEWAFGTTSNLGSLVFKKWESTVINPATDMVGQNMVVHLITDNIYIDIKFLSWASGGSGGSGGFSYERSTNQTLSLNENNLKETIRITPNPSSSFIYIINLTNAEDYKIYNILGVKIAEGTLNNNNQITIQHLKSGIYILHFKNGTALRFVKK